MESPDDKPEDYEDDYDYGKDGNTGVDLIGKTELYIFAHKYTFNIN